MDTCEVLVVGGGPAGSVCAWKLVRAGLDVLLLDKETFPREKPCAGWITPAVFDALELSAGQYRHGRVLQEISCFKTGLIGGTAHLSCYGTTVGYGIRRSEFDHYLLQGSGVRSRTGEAVTSLERTGGWWVVNGAIRTRMLVGAGGHFCPVARLLGAGRGREAVAAAQVAEYAISSEEARDCNVSGDTPCLFFCRDMKGYGWLFRKENYLNVGLGRLDMTNLPFHVRQFRAFLERRGDLSPAFRGVFQGHAYRLCGIGRQRVCAGDGVLLAGDAAGVAHPQSGEGILPAIESALLAAETIIDARGDYRSEILRHYEAKLALASGGSHPEEGPASGASRCLRYLVPLIFSSGLLTRRIVLDRRFVLRGLRQTSGKQL